MEEMDFFDDDDLLDFEEEADDDNKDKKSPQETVGQDFGAELLLSEGCLNLQLKQNEIHFNSLAALNLEDLEILGLPDFGKRQQVLNEISHIPNQDIHFDKVLRETNIDQHKEDVLQSVNKHLRDLKTSIAVANLKFQVLPPEYILVDETTYCSSLVLKLLNEIEKNAELMEKNLLELIEGKFEEKPKKTKLKILINSICVIGAVSASTFLIYSASAANIKFEVFLPEDILVDETTYCSSLVLKLLNEIEKNAGLMEKNLLELIEGRFEEKPKKTKLKKLINSICVIGAVSASTFLIYSACKSRFSK